MSVVDSTFKELDERLSILDKDTINFIKIKILNHITEAYERGKRDGRDGIKGDSQKIIPNKYEVEWAGPTHK